jgi:clan AA aspartic protease
LPALRPRGVARPLARLYAERRNFRAPPADRLREKEAPMGKVMTKVKLTNNTDLENSHRGILAPDRVRSVEVEALVDTGATMMVIPAEVAVALGLEMADTRRVRYADGRTAALPRATAVRIEILGRDMVSDALVEAAGTTPLVGQIPLEALDLVVDPRSRDVHVNPASPDMPLLDLLAARAA